MPDGVFFPQEPFVVFFDHSAVIMLVTKFLLVALSTTAPHYAETETLRGTMRPPPFLMGLAFLVGPLLAAGAAVATPLYPVFRRRAEV